MGSVEPKDTVIAPGTPTQVAHPWKAFLRTLVASGVGFVLTWVALEFGIDLAGLSEGIVTSITAALWTAITGFVQWLLVHPKLQKFWRIVGLGTGVENE